jgi:hypothetical protein
MILETNFYINLKIILKVVIQENREHSSLNTLFYYKHHIMHTAQVTRCS